MPRPRATSATSWPAIRNERVDQQQQLRLLSRPRCRVRPRRRGRARCRGRPRALPPVIRPGQHPGDSWPDCVSHRASRARVRSSIDSTLVCGIVGYVGARQAQDVVLDGLRRLEYRGYDSAGIAVVATDARRSRRRRASSPTSRRPSRTTRCRRRRPASATPGGPPTAPERRNAHPHVGYAGRVALVHNGIIENFAELRVDLRARWPRAAPSETDTEVAAQLLELDPVLSGVLDLTAAMLRLVSRLTPWRLHAGGRGRAGPFPALVAARRNSPLVHQLELSVNSGKAIAASLEAIAACNDKGARWSCASASGSASPR